MPRPAKPRRHGRPPAEGGHGRKVVSLNKGLLVALEKAREAGWKPSHLLERMLESINSPLWLAVVGYQVVRRRVYMVVYNLDDVDARITAVKCDGVLVGCLSAFADLYKRDFDAKHDRSLVSGIEVMPNPVPPVNLPAAAVVSFRLPKTSSLGSFSVKLCSYYAEATFGLGKQMRQTKGILYSSEMVAEFRELGYTVDGRGMLIQLRQS
jgi:hypothetical protein